MVAAARIPLGAPGVRFLPDVPLRAITGVRMDVCAFFGVAPRGPVRVPVVDEKWPDNRPCVEPERPHRRTWPVAVESFDDYRRLFGAFEGPGLLPYAVASFFEQGGRKAYIARIVHDYEDALQNSARVAAGALAGVITPAGPLRLLARSEGRWGNLLIASLSFGALPLSFESTTLAGFDVDDSADLPVGSMLRLRLNDRTTALRFIATSTRLGRPTRPGAVRRLVFDTPVSVEPAEAEILEASLRLQDGANNRESHERLGLTSLHPRWMATVLCYESSLVYPDSAWADSEIYPEPAQPGIAFTGGEDDYPSITPEDFFDSSWTFGDEEPGQGICSLTGISDTGILVAPDLYSPEPLAAVENIVDPVSLAGPEFQRCVDLPVPPDQDVAAQDLAGLRFDPRQPSDLQQIVTFQQRLVDFAVLMRTFVVLLDVPPGLNPRQILQWRTAFGSDYAAAYHPWLKVSRRDDTRDALIELPPSAAAAGIIARTENTYGIAYGPANTPAREIVDVATIVSATQHNELHPQGINIYLRERDGITLTAARTLARNPDYRQLSVRRLVTMIRLAVEQQTQWIVFEPNNPALRAQLCQLLVIFLRRLYQSGAFRGAEESEAFFVRCDAELNPLNVQDAGILIAQIGIAPAEPLEFILVRLTRSGDGTLAVED